MVPLEEIILLDLPLFSQACFKSMKNTSKNKNREYPILCKVCQSFV